MTRNKIAHSFEQKTVLIASALDRADMLNLDRYKSYVAHLDLPEERKMDIMLAVYRTMQSFADRAFGDDPVQRRGCLAGNRISAGEAPELPVIDCEIDNLADETLSDAFRYHANGANQKKKR